MSPAHHDERLHYWSKKKGFPVLALEYSKAPGMCQVFISPSLQCDVAAKFLNGRFTICRIPLSICFT